MYVILMYIYFHFVHNVQDYLEYHSQDVTLSQDSVQGEGGVAGGRRPIMDYNHPVYNLY